MPQPALSDVHVNRPLTNASLMFSQELGFVADKVFPNIPVDKRSDLYFTYNQGDFYRSVAKERADATESAGSGYGLDSSGSYTAKVIALHHDVGDQTRANQDDPLDEDLDATYFLTNQGLLKREKDWVTSFFSTSVWTGGADTANCGLSGTDVSVDVKWDNASGVPIKCMKEQIAAGVDKFGLTYKYNTLVLPFKVWNAVQDSADFLDRIKGGATTDTPAIMNTQLLAAILGIDNVFIAGASENTAIEGHTASYTNLYGNSALLCYVTPRPGKRVITAGYTFSWKQYGATDLGMRMGRFRMEQLKADRVEMELAYSMKVMVADLGAFFVSVLT